MKTYVLIAAGGSGSRMQAGINKVFLSLNGKTVLRRSIEAFRGTADHLILTVRPEDEERVRAEAELAEPAVPVTVAPGGDTRQESVLNGLRAVQFASDDIVLVHDAARCLVDMETICRVVDSTAAFGSGIPAVPVI